MKRLYLDTNVFLAVYAPADKGHKSSARLVEAVEAGRINAATSTLTLIEVASVVRRSGRKFLRTEDSDHELPGSFVRRILHLKNLEYIELGSTISLGEKSQVRIPTVYAIALKAVRTLPLRALDLLHVASAYAMVRLLGKELDFFITLDQEILDVRKEIKEFLGCPSVTPDEVLKLETP